MRIKLAVPDIATRERLLSEDFAFDPQPPPCAQHNDTQKHARICGACRARKNWRWRMSTRFAKLGFSFTSNPFILNGDPKPPPCKDHADCQKHRRHCTACLELDRWRSREYRRALRSGKGGSHTTDIAPVIAHINALEAAGMLLTEVARRADIDSDVIYRIRRGDRTRIRTRTKEQILAIPLPERPRPLVSDTTGAMRSRVSGVGAFRRMRALAADGFGLLEQGVMMGYSQSAVYGWFSRPTITVEADDAVFELYRRLADKQGTNLIAAGHARKKGWLGRRFYSEGNIDDPTYNPMKKIKKPWGLWRRLRALAWLGHGPEEVAAELGEPAETVREWMLGGPAPAYSTHLVSPLYERWSFAQGNNQEAADLARHMQWPPPLAWDDIDIDSPCSQPRVSMPINRNGEGKTRHMLTSMVFDAIDGKVSAKDLIPAEKVQVVRVLHRRGWSDRRIAAWLRWNGASTVEDLDLAGMAVKQFRVRHEIDGFGMPDSSYETKRELIVFGAAA